MIASPSPPSIPALDPLGVDCAARGGEAHALASRYLDPSLVDVLRILGFGTTRARKGLVRTLLVKPPASCGHPSL
jgi:hypothetical protein